MNATSLTGRRPGAGWLRRLAVAASAAAITVMGVVAAPIVPNSPVADTVPQAQAQNSSGSGSDAGVGARTYDFGGCVIRDGHQTTLNLDDVNRRMLGSVCWLDFGERQDGVRDDRNPDQYANPGGYFGSWNPNLTYTIPEGNGSTVTGTGASEPVVREFKISDRFTLKATIQTNVPPTWWPGSSNEYFSVLRRWRSSAYAAFGYEAFVPHNRDRARPLIMMERAATRASGGEPRVWLDNIELYDNGSGTAIDTFTMVAADGERTQSSGEYIYLTARQGVNKETVPEITPITRTIKLRNQNDACGRAYGPGQGFQFVCNHSGGTPGMFVASVDSPSFFSARLDKGSGQHQGVAFGIVLGSIGADVIQPDTTVETTVTGGTPTEFDLKLFRQDVSNSAFRQTQTTTETELPYPVNVRGTLQPYFRDNSGPGLAPEDYLLFRSSAKNNQSTAFERYQVRWVCTDGSGGVTTVVNEGTTGAYTLRNNLETGVSEVRVYNPLMRAVECTAQWTPRFEFARLRLSKELRGDAANTSALAGARYPFRYECTHPEFLKAYEPDAGTWLSGNVAVAGGTAELVETIPAGAECRIMEDFSDESVEQLARDLEKLDHKVSWAVSTSGNPAASSPLAEPSTATSLTLAPRGTGAQPRSNNVAGTNHVNFWRATAQLQASFRGEAAQEAATVVNRTVDYAIRCTEGSYDQRRSLSLARGTTLVDSVTPVDYEGIPRAQECTVVPLTGLPQQGEIEFVQRTLYSGDTRLDSHVAGDGELAPLTFTIPADFEGTYPLRVETEYRYLSRDITVTTEASGPARQVPAIANIRGKLAYECVQAGSNYRKVGQLDDITFGQTVTIPVVRVGATCSFRFTPENVQDVSFAVDKSTITYRPGNNQGTTTRPLTDAQDPIVPVLGAFGDQSGTIDGLNQTVISAYFDYILVTPRVAFSVDDSQVPAAARALVPHQFQVSFECQPRKVVSGSGETDVTPRGTVIVPRDGQMPLTANADSATVNDQAGGTLGIPVGSACTFSDIRPMRDGAVVELPGWLQWNKQGNARVVFNTAPRDVHTFASQFSVKNDGVSLTQQIQGVRFAPADGLSYALSCQLDGVEVLSRPFALPNAAQHTDTQQLPDGAQCSLTVPEDSGVRTGISGDFPVQRNSVVKIGTSQPGQAQDAQAPATQASFDYRGGQVDFVVAEGLFITVAHTYGYVPGEVTIQQTVSVDRWGVSDALVDYKNSLVFQHQLVCREPLATDESENRVYSADLKGTANQRFEDIPIGSSCTVTSKDYQPAEGMILTRNVSEAPVTVAEASRVEISYDFERKREILSVTHNEVFPGNISNEVLRELPAMHEYSVRCEERVLPNTPATVVLNVPLNRQDGELKAEVPAGTDCVVMVAKLVNRTISQPVEPGTWPNNDAVMRTEFRPLTNDWIVNPGTGTEIGEKVDVAAEVALSPRLTIRPANEQGSPVNRLRLRTEYDYVTTGVQLVKKVVGHPADIDILARADEPIDFGFSYRCRGVGFDYSSESVGLPTRVEFVADQWQHSDGTWSYSSEVKNLPTGALCSVQEPEPEDVPDALTLKIGEPQYIVVAGQPENQAQEIVFTNEFSRRTVPVAVVSTHSGYLVDLDDEIYETTVRCVYPGENSAPMTATATIPAEKAIRIIGDDGIDSDQEPADGVAIVQLPVGLECEATLGGSATQPRTVLAKTNNNERRPRNEVNIFVPGSDAAQETGSDAVTFTLPTDLRVPEEAGTEAEAVAAISTRSYHVRDMVKTTFTKVAQGADPQQEFRFRAHCGTGDVRTFRLKSGGSIDFDAVSVERECVVEELVEPGQPRPIGSFGDDEASGFTGAGLVDRTVFYDGTTGALTWKVKVAPVPEVDDSSQEFSRNGYWTLAAVNKLPSISLDKEVVGAASTLPSLPGSRGTAVLPSTAETVTVKYTVKNTGAFPLSDGMTIKDPSLAGLTLRAGAQTHEVEPSGLIPAGFCQSTSAGASPYGMALDPGQSWQCQVEVELPAGGGYYFNNGENAQVEATAQVSGAEVPEREASVTGTAPAAGVLRLPAWLDSMLPNTGSPWLISLLVLGIIAVGYGLYRYVRLRDEDEETVASAAGNE